jgi:hypothetical protein
MKIKVDNKKIKSILSSKGAHVFVLWVVMGLLLFCLQEINDKRKAKQRADDNARAEFHFLMKDSKADDYTFLKTAEVELKRLNVLINEYEQKEEKAYVYFSIYLGYQYSTLEYEYDEKSLKLYEKHFKIKHPADWDTYTLSKRLSFYESYKSDLQKIINEKGQILPSKTVNYFMAYKNYTPRQDYIELFELLGVPLEEKKQPPAKKRNIFIDNLAS